MYIDNDNFVAWMERIMDRLDMQDKKWTGSTCRIKR